MKACTRCGAVKPLEEFHRDASRPDGRMSRCAACCREEANTRYRAAHPARAAAAPGHKRCRRCGLERPLEEFGPRPDARDGRKSWCRPCEAERRRDVREEGTT